MATDSKEGKQEVTLQEIEELYDRLGIPTVTNEPPRTFEEYAWRYGFHPQDTRKRTTLDTHTAKPE